jgi:ABC-type transporter MlaC component
MFVSAVVAVALAATPAERTEGMLAAFKAVKAPAEKGAALPAGDREANDKAFAALDGFIDFDAIVEGAIAPHKKKLSAAELDHYRSAFKELVRRVAYPDSGRFLSRAVLKVGASKTSGKVTDVPVKMTVAADDLETDVTFHWSEKAGAWRLVDASFDGASLVKDYQNQFGRIIDKDGAKGLLDKLDKRLDKERKAPVL